MVKLVTAAMAAALMSATPAFAGAAFEYETHYLNYDEIEARSGHAQDGRLHMVGVARGMFARDEEMLFRPNEGEAGVLYITSEYGEVTAIDGAGPPDAFGAPIARRVAPTTRDPERVDGYAAVGVDVFEEGRRHFTVWTADASDVPGGGDLKIAYDRLTAWTARPSVPAEVRDKLFVYDTSLFGGRVMIGFDEYDDGDEIFITRRMRDIRQQAIDPAVFAAR